VETGVEDLVVLGVSCSSPSNWTLSSKERAEEIVGEVGSWLNSSFLIGGVAWEEEANERRDWLLVGRLLLAPRPRNG
jgi:hypothetical protein